MSATGDVLELVFGGAGSPVAVRAQVSERRDVAVAERVAADVMQRALNRYHMPHLPLLVRGGIGLMAASVRLSLRHLSDHPAGPTGESSLSIWRSTSGRLRLERTWQSDVRRERLVSVNVPSVQQRIWPMGLITYDHGTQRTLRFGGQWPAPSAHDADRLFDRQDICEIVGALILDNPRDGTVAGRAVIEVDARLREPLASGFDSLPIGADVYTLSIDRKYGHLLRIEARTEGHAFEVIEVTGVSYGDDIPSELFHDPKLPTDRFSDGDA